MEFLHRELFDTAFTELECAYHKIHLFDFFFHLLHHLKIGSDEQVCPGAVGCVHVCIQYVLLKSGCGHSQVPQL